MSVRKLFRYSFFLVLSSVILINLGCYKTDEDKPEPTQITKPAQAPQPDKIGQAAAKPDKSDNKVNPLEGDILLPENLQQCAKQPTVLGALIDPKENRFHCPDYLDKEWEPACGYFTRLPEGSSEAIFLIELGNKCRLCLEYLDMKQEVNIKGKDYAFLGFTLGECPKPE